MNDPVPPPGGAMQDPFAPQASIEGFPLQPPGPIQPGGLHEHGFASDAFGSGGNNNNNSGFGSSVFGNNTNNNGFGSSAFGGQAAPAAPAAASGNPFADEPPPAFAPAAAATYASSSQHQSAFPEPSAFGAPPAGVPSMFPMAGVSNVPPPTVPPVAAAPSKPKGMLLGVDIAQRYTHPLFSDAFDEIVNARVGQGSYQSSPSYAASPAAGVHAAPAAQASGGGYPALYGTAPTAANPFGGPPPAWSAQPVAPATAAAQKQADPFDALLSLPR